MLVVSVPVAGHDRPLTLNSEPIAGIGPWPYVVMVGGNAADWATTYRVQQLGQYEGNSLVGQNPWIMLPMKAGGTIFIGWLMHKMTKAGHPTAAKILGYAIGGATGFIATRNEQFYRDRLRWHRAVAQGTAVCDARGCRY